MKRRPARSFHPELLPLVKPWETSLEIDVDGDDVKDFAFYYKVTCTDNEPTSYCLTSLHFKSLRMGAEYSLNDGIGYFNAGNPIVASLIWEDEYWYTLAWLSWNIDSGNDDMLTGSWTELTDKYVGLRLTIDGRYQYGWMQINADAATNEFEVLDIYINAQSGQAVKAGVK